MQGQQHRQLLINVVILSSVVPVSHVYCNVGRTSLRKDRGIQHKLEQQHEDREDNCGPNRKRTQTISEGLCTKSNCARNRIKGQTNRNNKGKKRINLNLLEIYYNTGKDIDLFILSMNPWPVFL